MPAEETGISDAEMAAVEDWEGPSSDASDSGSEMDMEDLGGGDAKT